jgi:ATP-grasp domain, R2K clade family 3
MNEKYQNIQWVVQRNLTNPSDFEGLKNSCLKIGTKFIHLDIVPFTEELPNFDSSRNSIIYGSTIFNALALKDKNLRNGLFFDEEIFSIENYIEKWGRHMLNYEASITTFEELIDSAKYSPNKLLFIRPNDDSKSFAGEVKQYGEIVDWYKKLEVFENTNLSTKSKIIVSEPYNIQYEWRLWIVNKKVIAASKYREYFNLKKERGCPTDVISFAEDRCEEYTPHNVFVMDICLCGDEYFVIECGCMNAAGFYKANIDDIVFGVTEYFSTTF